MTGGIYMASTVDESCRAWNCKIIKDEESGLNVIGKHGNIEHLRYLLPEKCGKSGTMVQNNQELGHEHCADLFANFIKCPSIWLL